MQVPRRTERRGMFNSWNQSRRAAAAKALVVLVSATGCLAAAAYAASAPSAPGRGDVIRPAARSVEARSLVPGPRTGGGGLARPRIVRHPAKATLSTRVSFRYASRQADVDFACKLDDAGWKRCARTRVAYRGLAVGAHQFFVRVEAGGAHSRPARFA